MDFDSFNRQALADHATDPRGVADRLDDAKPLVMNEAQLSRLANLAHHVHGAHLREWKEGAAFIEGLAAMPMYAPDGPSGAAMKRLLSSLALSAGASLEVESLSPSDRIRVGALAASNLVETDVERAGQLLRDAVERADRSGLPRTDPMHRDLAVTGNNLASTLEEKASRTEEERALMILAAETARQHWEIAGGWLETERAEYRLANTWLKAGDFVRAREHAQACLDIVSANDGPALERLFAWEALGLVERESGNVTGHAEALVRVREAFDQLEDAEKEWCAASVEKLAA